MAVSIGFVKRPDTWILQYWDDSTQEWVGTELNRYNATTHDVVTVTAMRVTVELRAGRGRRRFPAVVVFQVED
jgi:hypothetical protein